MLRFVIRRLLMVIPIMLGVVFLVFFIMSLTPGDPGRLILGISASQADVDKLNEELGYDRPFFAKFLEYIVNLVTRFDMGRSYQTRRTVSGEIVANFPYTFRLALLSTAVYVLIGVPLGVMSAVKQYSVGDNIARVVSISLAAFPSFWLAMMGILVFSLWLGLLPSNGVDTWKHYILPVCISGISSSASLLRLTRTIMLESVRQDYVRTARAKGVPENIVIWKHVFQNAMLPIIMTVGIDFGIMMGGTVLMETIFSMPGLGALALTAIRQKDMPVVMGCTIFLSGIFCIMVLLVDLVSAFADPRVKAKYAK